MLNPRIQLVGVLFVDDPFTLFFVSWKV